MENAIQSTFKKRHAVLPVVHVLDYDQALQNTNIAFDAGCDGVFLINHRGYDETLQQIASSIHSLHFGKWVGINCLGLNPLQAFSEVPNLSGVWCDNAGIEEDPQKDQSYPDRVRALQKNNCPDSLYFGGVAFKYQRPVRDLENTARIAMKYMDVVTTSGPGTGEAASIDKIRRMKKALNGGALAIASGITPENVVEYLPFADAFLVATGISKSFEDLDPELTELLVKRVRIFDHIASTMDFTQCEPTPPQLKQI